MDGTGTAREANRVPQPRCGKNVRLVQSLPAGTAIRAARGDDFEAVTALLETLGRAQVPDATREDARAVFRQQGAHPAAHHPVVEDAGGRLVAFCSLPFRTRLNYA